MHPERVPNRAFDAVAGNECIGARRYEAFLIGCGAQAVSSLPGARIENTVDVHAWASDVESGRHSFALTKCSLEHQYDMALWVFPLMADGLATEEYDTLVKAGRLTQEQTADFEAFQREGLIIRSGDRYQLSIVGEVFMGHLVRELKKNEDRAAVDGYIDEGYALGALLAEGKLPSLNEINDRQKATRYLQMLS